MYDNAGPRPPGGMHFQDNCGFGKGNAGPGSEMMPEQKQNPVQLQQKMLRQRQMVLERQRQQAARSRFPGGVIAQANPVAVAPAMSANLMWGGLFSETAPAEGGLGLKQPLTLGIDPKQAPSSAPAAGNIGEAKSEEELESSHGHGQGLSGTTPPSRERSKGNPKGGAASALDDLLDGLDCEELVDKPAPERPAELAGVVGAEQRPAPQPKRPAPQPQPQTQPQPQSEPAEFPSPTRAPAVSLPAPMFNTPHQRASRPAMGDVEDRPGAKGDAGYRGGSAWGGAAPLARAAAPQRGEVVSMMPGAIEEVSGFGPGRAGSRTSNPSFEQPRDGEGGRRTPPPPGRRARAADFVDDDEVGGFEDARQQNGGGAAAEERRAPAGGGWNLDIPQAAAAPQQSEKRGGRRWFGGGRQKSPTPEAVVQETTSICDFGGIDD